jgi:tetratricopeptide (TPR) repeat protein
MSKEKFWSLFLLVSGCILVYSNSLYNAFVLDDIPAISNNLQIKQLFSFWLDPQTFLNSLAYNLTGLNVVTYHLISILVHSMNTVLVFLFIRLFLKTIPSFFGALLFAVHPIHSEAVAWISGRPYLIFTFFTLLTYFLYYKATYSMEIKKGNQKIYFILSLLIFSYFIFKNFTFYILCPFLIILSDLVFDKWRDNWKLWTPFILIVLIRIFFAQDILQRRITATLSYLGYGIDNNELYINPFFSFIYSIFSHLWLLLWPSRLTFYHEPIIFRPLFILLGSIVLCLSVCFLPSLFKNHKLILFGVGIYTLFLFPTFSPLPIATVVAERYAYFPSIALSIIAAYFFERRFKRENYTQRKWFTVLFIVVIIAATVRTLIRNGDWRDSEILFRKTLEISPKSPSAHVGMATVYFHQGNIDKAIEGFNQAIQLKPNYAEAYNNRANAYYSRGMYNQAISDLNLAIKFKPDYALAFYNRGMVFYNMGDFNRAILDLDNAIQFNPDYAEAYNSRAIAYFYKKEYKKSREDLSKAEYLGYKVDPIFQADLEKHLTTKK